MPRCVACDYCNTIGEMSPYKWGLTVPNYSGRFIFDPRTGEEYCEACWVDYGELFDFSDEWKLMKEGTENASIELDSVGGVQVGELERSSERCDEETDNES